MLTRMPPPPPAPPRCWVEVREHDVVWQGHDDDGVCGCELGGLCLKCGGFGTVVRLGFECVFEDVVPS